MTERFQTLQAVFVLLRNDKNEILLQKRAGTGYLDGYWDFPSGHVEFGESLRDTASRETKEEINIDVAPEDLELIHIKQFFVERNYINYTFEARSWQGEPRICEPEKCSALDGSLPIHYLENALMPSVQLRLAALARNSHTR